MSQLSFVDLWLDFKKLSLPVYKNNCYVVVNCSVSINLHQCYLYIWSLMPFSLNPQKGQFHDNVPLTKHSHQNVLNACYIANYFSHFWWTLTVIACIKQHSPEKRGALMQTAKLVWHHKDLWESRLSRHYLRSQPGI